MDLNFTKEQESFQIEVRSFLNDNLEPQVVEKVKNGIPITCLLYTSPSPRDRQKSRMPSSA